MTFVASVTSDLPSGRSRRRTARDPKAVLFVLSFIAAATLLFFQNLIGLGLGPLFFGMLSDWIQPVYGAESVRYVLYAHWVLV